MAPINKTADKKLDAYVYRIIGRWKDARGVEYVFRRDGSCAVAGQEAYFGGSGYEITMGAEPYPTEGAFTVVSLKNKTLTLKNQETKKNVRLNYVGEPTPQQPAEETPDAAAQGADERAEEALQTDGAGGDEEKDKPESKMTEE